MSSAQQRENDSGYTKMLKSNVTVIHLATAIQPIAVC